MFKKTMKQELCLMDFCVPLLLVALLVLIYFYKKEILGLVGMEGFSQEECKKSDAVHGNRCGANKEIIDVGDPSKGLSNTGTLL